MVTRRTQIIAVPGTSMADGLSRNALASPAFNQDKADDVAQLLAGALPLAEAEPGTVAWCAARTSPTTFWIFDTFAPEGPREAHINGEIAAALMSKADELLAAPPEILCAGALAGK